MSLPLSLQLSATSRVFSQILPSAQTAVQDRRLWLYGVLQKLITLKQEYSQSSQILSSIFSPVIVQLLI